MVLKRRVTRSIVSMFIALIMLVCMVPYINVHAATNDNSGLVNYRTHVQSYGWQEWKADGQSAGTSGEAKRLECIEIKLGDTGYAGGITYRTHVQSYGWLDWITNGQMSGTFGMAKRLEGIEISLYGDVSEYYDVYYRVHVQSYGWQDWVSNGQMAGTSGEAKRLEAIEIKLVKKEKKNDKKVTYRTHVQSYGWQDWKKDGQMAGTSGEAKRLEGIQISLGDTGYKGTIKYSTHVQTYGWQNDKFNGAMAGTSGEAKRLEAIKISLAGEVSEYYDVYYRVHVQTYGWQDWKKNGEVAGTSGEGKRLEGIEIKLVEKEKPKSKATKLELSGNSKDTYTINTDSYVEGEDVILYIPKGVTIKGDMLKVTEKIMADLCETTGLTFDKNYELDSYMECRDMYYEPGIFEDINKDNKKVNLLIINENGGEAWAVDNSAVVDILEYDYDSTFYQVIYHELAHVLQFRNGPDLGRTMDEGFATYITFICQMEHDIPAWNAVQYFYPAEDVAKKLIEGKEDAFLYQQKIDDTNYQYGFRFVMFLTEKYGEDIYYKIMEEADKRGFTSAITGGKEEEGFNNNNKLLKEIIKSQTSEDVFERFADWYANEWNKIAEDNMKKIENMSN